MGIENWRGLATPRLERLQRGVDGDRHAGVGVNDGVDGDLHVGVRVNVGVDGDLHVGVLLRALAVSLPALALVALALGGVFSLRALAVPLLALGLRSRILQRKDR